MRTRQRSTGSWYVEVKEAQTLHSHPGDLQVEGAAQHQGAHAEVRDPLQGNLLPSGPVDDDPTMPRPGFDKGWSTR
jgi:hypothetical protein